jgi:hypothetical protein
LADVVEAVLGAVYREGGYLPAMACVERLLGEQLVSVTPRDPKTELQEALHASGSEAPVYRLECVEGPEHAPIFISVVEVDGQVVGRGKGPTKKASQQNAAEEALGHLKGGDEIDAVFRQASGEDLNQGDAAGEGVSEHQCEVTNKPKQQCEVGSGARMLVAEAAEKSE